ncbi:hypothetical protein CC85DRAFT_285730 [Cutaneotrichosporon oleaginosum]|uniref:Uncharacterized protein n=1 Tax=Cutaneotrichosporon oleaginosum TaxID=879819 RepID=A0A0J1B3D0_9TREE|nr:uncharacterized protein CC85DRAFT_285730 [Cutaneotrichosporon oleaginosum]KLT42134.1 hypothetical protein CC85DRAFT_285730 [Cutaneotrichosporon oleaginosum]TXT11741.1 hypothetical protein COLE_02151 [Cutaneotrichosporon oleaginosum]
MPVIQFVSISPDPRRSAPTLFTVVVCVSAVWPVHRRCLERSSIYCSGTAVVVCEEPCYDSIASETKQRSPRGQFLHSLP